MISKKSLIRAGLIALTASAATQTVVAQEYKKIYRLGTSQSVCEGGVKNAEELQDYFAKNPDVIKTILADSGWTGSADALLAAVANGEMQEQAFPQGTKLAWMGSKKDGKYVALPYREWGASTPFEGFALNVKSDCQVYEMVIPKACCNVSLAAVSKDTSAECNPDAANVAPAADTNELDTSAAQDTLPAVSDKAALGLIPFVAAFAGSETRPRFEPAWQMDKKDSSGIYGLKAGLLKELNAKTSLTGALSYYERNGINSGNIYPEDNFAIDLGIERKLSEKAFIGGGIGAWNVDDSDFRDTSLYGLVGGDLGKSKLQWFLEGRVFDSDSDSNDSISDNKMFSAGIRYLIK